MIKYLSLCIIFLSLIACKIINTHTIKLTSSVEVQSTSILLKTTQGMVYLSSQNLSEKDKEILQSLRPFQCLELRTSEPFDMKNREVHFSDFKFRKIIESDSQCRKVKVTTRISMH